ncbi:MAG: hypothetical protein GYB67_00995 [Chloroflexi bacterium]|nr:hypothetical protein [Chloroflexota bacterium]
MLRRLQPHHLALIEAALIGLFFVQATRFLIGMLYSRVAGAAALLALDPAALPADLPGVVDPVVVGDEITFAVYMLALPLFAVLLGHLRSLLVIAAVITAAGRALMLADIGLTPTSAAALTVGGGLLYLAVLARHRVRIVPYVFVFGFALDQLFRAVGNTLDPSWSPSYLNIQVGLSVAVVLLTLISVGWEQRRARSNPDSPAIAADRGLLPLWGGFGLAGLLYLQLALLALPNAIAGRADVDYTTFVPFVLAATLLPVVPVVRGRARRFIGLFDGRMRGWTWMLLAALLIVIGTRFQGVVAGASLVIAQAVISLMWWWVVRPKTGRERGFGGLWLILGVMVFGLLVIGDNFIYEYAFVRDFTGDLAFLNPIIPPLLRGFRGLGLALLLLAVFLAAIPMTQTQRRIPWLGSTWAVTLFASLLVIGASLGAAFAARPPVVEEESIDEFRVGTFNIHGGYSEFYDYNLEAVASAIDVSGVQVVLVQEIEAGRLASFGVDQPLWLARRLGMDRRFFPTNEGLQGLAVLSKIGIAFDDGELLPSIGQQTGVQRVQMQPEPGVVLTLYNTWLSPLFEIAGQEGLDLQQQDQLFQRNALLQVIANHHPDGVLGRTIIGGTFNNVPDSPLIEELPALTGFADPFAGCPIQTCATFARSGLPPARFDYLWLRNLTSAGSGVINNGASDHALAFAGVDVNRLLEP